MKIYSEEQIDLFMDSISDFYDYICNPCTSKRISFIKKLITSLDKNISCFMDLSCSTGETILNLSDNKDITFIGLDLSAGMISRSIAKCINKKNTKFLQGDMRHVDEYGLSNIDIVYSNSLEWLYNYENISSVVKAVYNILSPNGFFILDIVNDKNFNKKCKTFYANYKKNDNIYYKNVHYSKIDKSTYIINQTYNILNLDQKQIITRSAFFKYAPLNIKVLKKILEENRYHIYKKFYDYGTGKKDNLLVVARKNE